MSLLLLSFDAINHCFGLPWQSVFQLYHAPLLCWDTKSYKSTQIWIVLFNKPHWVYTYNPCWWTPYQKLCIKCHLRESTILEGTSTISSDFILWCIGYLLCHRIANNMWVSKTILVSSRSVYGMICPDKLNIGAYFSEGYWRKNLWIFLEEEYLKILWK